MRRAIPVALVAALSSSVVMTSAVAGSLTTEVSGVRFELTSAPETGGPWDLTIRVVRPAGRVEIPLREEVARQR